MSKLSPAAADALALAIASRGPNKGKLLKNAPPLDTPANAAWMGVVAVANPYRLTISSLLFMSKENKAIYDEVEAFVKANPGLRRLDRFREVLDGLGVAY